MANKKLPARDVRSIVLRIPVNARERRTIEERARELQARYGEHGAQNANSLAAFVRFMALCAELPAKQ